MTCSGVSKNHTLCVYLFAKKILPCAFISLVLNSTMTAQFHFLTFLTTYIALFTLLLNNPSAPSYRVSHSKPGKVILLWWGYRFWFLPILGIIRVYEKGTITVPSSSVYFFAKFSIFLHIVLDSHIEFPFEFFDKIVNKR
jgi:hypothetical protein